MPPRRSIKKGRVQKLAAASESILLRGSNAASPVGSDSDDDAIDDVEADKENSHGNKRSAGEGLSPSQHEMQTEYVEKIIEEVEKKGAHGSNTGRRMSLLISDICQPTDVSKLLLYIRDCHCCQRRMPQARMYVCRRNSRAERDDQSSLSKHICNQNQEFPSCRGKVHALQGLYID